MEKITSTRINKWLSNRGLITSAKVETVVSKTVYKPSDFALKIGIVEEETVDKRSGEVKAQIKLGESAQLFLFENLEEIISTTYFYSPIKHRRLYMAKRAKRIFPLRSFFVYLVIIVAPVSIFPAPSSVD